MAKKEEIPEALPEEETIPEEETTKEEPVTSNTITLTSDELPALAGLGVGDTITLRVANVSDDGTSFDLEPVTEEATPTSPGEGKEEVTKAML